MAPGAANRVIGPGARSHPVVGAQPGRRRSAPAHSLSASEFRNRTMAEARSIAAMGGEFKSGVRLHYGDEGLHVDLGVTIPPPRVIAFRMRRWAYHAWVGLQDALYPYGLPLALLVTSLVVGRVVTSSPDSWWRSGWLAQRVWDLS